MLSDAVTKSVTPRTSANAADFLIGGKRPDSVALRLLDGNYTYGQLRAAANDVARYFVSHGWQDRDRVLLAGDNSFFWVTAYLGVLQAGLVCVPLPINISRTDLSHVLNATDARWAFVQARFAVTQKEALKSLALVTDREVDNLEGATSFDQIRAEAATLNIDRAASAGDDLAALMFTSGSTGKPRGVMVSHANIIANTQSIVQYLGLTPDDRTMTVLPFHYCFGTSLLHTHLHVGASLVIDPRFMYPEKVLERMQETECSGFAGVPSHFQILLRKSSFRKRQFPHLRYVQQAGGHLAPSFIRELRETLPSTKIFVMYGQTEATARLAYVPPEDLDRKRGSIGRAIPGVKLQVSNQTGQPVIPGEIGEIIAEGGNVTQGYWRDPAETALHFRNGKLYTGDLATVDEEGFIYVVDRAKDFLKCGGKRVSCRQLEEKLLEFDELLEVAVVGMADELLGEAVKVFVVPRNSHSEGLEDRVLQFCKQNFAHQLVPKEILVISSLPKNSAGKVLKHQLRRTDA